MLLHKFANFKGLCLFFLSNFPEAMFIPGAMFIPDSSVDQVGRALRQEIISCWNWKPQRNSNIRAALHKFARPKICHLVKVFWFFCCSAIFFFLLLFDIFPAKDMKNTIATIFYYLSFLWAASMTVIFSKRGTFSALKSKF